MGVDGGQTSTKCVLATTAGQVLGRGEGGPLVHLAAEGGRERFEHALREACANAWRAAQLTPQPIAAIGLGLTGVEADTPEARLVYARVPAILDAQRIDVQNDAYAALMGAHLGAPGVVVISGTGSIALGIDARGRQARAGGWGWLVGDEGSALAIGRSGLLAAFYAFDGVGPETALERAFVNHWSVPSMVDVKRLVYAPKFGQRGFAGLAPLVGQAADQGDAVAAQIVREAGAALARQVAAVVRRLDLAPAEVATAGGAFDHVRGLRRSFETAMQALPMPVRVVDPRLPPVLGAVIMALKRCQVDLSGAIAQLQAG